MVEVLFVTTIEEKDRERFLALPGAHITFTSREALREEDLRKAEVIIGNIPLDRFPLCENLKWFQTQSAGVSSFKDLPDKFVMTNASGTYGETISEYMLSGVLSILKELPAYEKQQKEHRWAVIETVRNLVDSTVLSVGMGDIGSAFARKCHALGATVYGVRRTVHDKPDYVEELFALKDLDRILPQCDIVALSLPETDETIGLFDAKRLSKMKPGSILVNIGRGTAIDTNALIKALECGTVGAAFLDVTDPEPLPADHPLWDTKNAYITPHISGRADGVRPYRVLYDLFYRNLCHYLAGEKLENIVDRTLGY